MSKAKSKQASKRLKAMGKTGRQLNSAYVRAATAICERAADLIDNPDDIETLHQYRISLRVARSLVKFGKPYLKREQYRKLSSSLKELQKPTSRVRELDMLVKQLGELDTPGTHYVEPVTGYRCATAGGIEAQQKVGSVLTQCREVQQAERNAFVEQLKTKKSRRAITRVARKMGALQWRKGVRKGGLARYELIERVSAERIACDEGLASVDPHDQQSVHSLRKRAKALRYVTRELADCLPKDSSKTSADMKAVQDKLGDMLDAQVNAQLLGEICGDAAETERALFEERAALIMQELEQH